MVTNNQNERVKKLTNIVIFVGNMAKWCLNVLKIWRP